MKILDNKKMLLAVAEDRYNKHMNAGRIFSYKDDELIAEFDEDYSPFVKVELMVEGPLYEITKKDNECLVFVRGEIIKFTEKPTKTIQFEYFNQSAEILFEIEDNETDAEFFAKVEKRFQEWKQILEEEANNEWYVVE